MRTNAVFAQITFSILTVQILGTDAHGQAPDLYGDFVIGHTVIELVDAARGNRPLLTDVWYPVDAEDADGMSPLRYYQHGGADLWWYESPFRGGVQDAPASSIGPFPTVVLSHGNGGWPGSFQPLGESLASHGYVVAAPRHTGNAWGTSEDTQANYNRNRPLDIVFTLDQLVAKSGDAADLLFGSVDESRVGLGGYSFGAPTVAGVLTGNGLGGNVLTPDPRPKAVLFIDQAPGGPFPVPLLHVGAEDGFFSSFPPGASSAMYGLDIPNADHWSFSSNACQFRDKLVESGAPPAVLGAVGPDSNWFGCAPGLTPLETVQELLSNQSLAFFDLYLKEDPTYESILQPAFDEVNRPIELLVRVPTARSGESYRFLVTDSLGRRLGVDPATGELVNDFAEGAAYRPTGVRDFRFVLNKEVFLAGEFTIAGLPPATLPEAREFQLSSLMTGLRDGSTVNFRKRLFTSELLAGEPFSISVTVVPEPSTLVLAVVCLWGVLAFRSRQKNTAY